MALAAASALESVYRISIRPRPSDPQPARAAAAAPRTAPLPLRLVDSGGVGIPLDQWGADYSHDRKAFRDVILEAAPYVDAAAFARVEEEWRKYVSQMLEYGNNAIAVPLLLELIDFDFVWTSTRPGAPSERATRPCGVNSDRFSSGLTREACRCFWTQTCWRSHSLCPSACARSLRSPARRVSTLPMPRSGTSIAAGSKSSSPSCPPSRGL